MSNSIRRARGAPSDPESKLPKTVDGGQPLARSFGADETGRCGSPGTGGAVAGVESTLPKTADGGQPLASAERAAFLGATRDFRAPDDPGSDHWQRLDAVVARVLAQAARRFGRG